MLTIFRNTMDLLKESFLELVTVIHVASNRHVESYIDGVVSKWPVPAILVPGGSHHLKYDALSASKVSLCTSDTVAVEMQLAHVPCVVAYRAHFLTEWFIRYKAKICYVSLPNILMDSAIIPEALFQ
ncbi:probable lipid-A-disaccharide synthase, mitochondrial [Cannabis sativa]|nr:probable lipid-A-disaccharide synthase, mitochondrial [Cannabis sativa]